MSDGFLLVGAGGHAKVVIAALRAGGHAITGLLDDNADRWGTQVLGVPILGPTQQLSAHTGPAVIAIGSNAVRYRIATAWPNVAWTSVIHPTAWLAPSVEVGVGTVIFAGAVVQPATRIGSHCILNTRSSVDHDGVVEDFVHVCPGAAMAGVVTLREGVFMGTGSAAIPVTEVGAWSTVGAGGAVVRNLPANVVAVGVPAKTIKTLPEGWHRS